MRSFMLGGALLLLSGCAFQSATVHVGEPLEVTNVAVRGPGATPGATDLVRSRATRMLTRAGRHAHGASAKVSVDVELAKPVDYLSFLHEDGIGAFVIVWPILAGLVIERDKLSVDVAIESNGHTRRGHGDAEKEGSVYAPSQKRALAVALSRAIASAR